MLNERLLRILFSSSRSGLNASSDWYAICVPEEYSQKRAAEMARTSLAAGKYPFEMCSNCESKVLELMTCIHLEELSGTASTEPNVDRLNLHRWLATHRAESEHRAFDRRPSAAR